MWSIPQGVLWMWYNNYEFLYINSLNEAVFFRYNHYNYSAAVSTGKLSVRKGTTGNPSLQKRFPIAVLENA